MASTPFSFSSETAAMEQVIAELFAKSVRIILESRFPHHYARNRIVDPFISSPPTFSSSHFRARDTCFNLTPNDCPAALDNFNLCRQSNLEQLVLDVILISKNAVKNAACTSPGGIFVRNLSSGRDEFGGSYRNGKIVERWIVQCDCQSTSQPERESSSQECNKGNSAAFQSSDFQVIYKKAYRRVIVLLRSLYSAVRLLPAYKLVRDINASCQTASAGKDFVGPITGLKVPSYTLPSIRFRSSSRFSFMDEFDDSDFICHFAEDDQAKNMYRVKSNNSKDYAGKNLCPGEFMAIRRSPDAAVGALVRMLRSAPPLRLDKSNTLISKQVSKDKGSSHKTQLEKMAGNKNDNLSKADDTQCLDIATSELFKLRTAADAFKELRTYKYIRELMLNQSRSQL